MYVSCSLNGVINDDDNVLVPADSAIVSNIIGLLVKYRLAKKQRRRIVKTYTDEKTTYSFQLEGQINKSA